MPTAEIFHETETVVRATFDAVEEMRWHDVVRLIHPAALERFRMWAIENEKHVEEFWSAGSERQRPTADGASEPEYPVELPGHSPAEQRTRMYGVSTVSELEQLSAEEVLARFLKHGDQRTHLLEQIEQDATMTDNLPARSLGGERFAIVGSVLEDPQNVHVVYRTTLADSPGNQANLDVVSVRWTEAGWRVWPRREEPKLFGGFTYFAQIIPRDEVRRQRSDAAAQIVEWTGEQQDTFRLRVDSPAADAVEGLILERRAPKEDARWELVAEIPQSTFVQVYGMMWPFAHDPSP